MTNREKLLDDIQAQVDWAKRMSDEDLASCVGVDAQGGVWLWIACRAEAELGCDILGHSDYSKRVAEWLKADYAEDA